MNSVLLETYFTKACKLHMCSKLVVQVFAGKFDRNLFSTVYCIEFICNFNHIYMYDTIIHSHKSLDASNMIALTFYTNSIYKHLCEIFTRCVDAKLMITLPQPMMVCMGTLHTSTIKHCLSCRLFINFIFLSIEYLIIYPFL